MEFRTLPFLEMCSLLNYQYLFCIPNVRPCFKTIHFAGFLLKIELCCFSGLEVNSMNTKCRKLCKRLLTFFFTSSTISSYFIHNVKILLAEKERELGGLRAINASYLCFNEFQVQSHHTGQ